MYDSAGKKQGTSLASGVPIALDTRRVAIVPEQANNVVTVLDIKSHKQVGEVELPDGGTFDSPWAARVADDTLVTLVPQADTKLVWVHAEAGKKPRIGKIVRLEVCP